MLHAYELGSFKKFIPEIPWGRKSSTVYAACVEVRVPHVTCLGRDGTAGLELTVDRPWPNKTMCSVHCLPTFDVEDCKISV